MNKAFEVIESHWLFDVSLDKIEVVVHPQSTIHSMVEFADGSIKAQMGPPDMRLPIQYALFYPQRLPNDMIPRLDISICHSLTFEPLEPERFPCFGLAMEAGRQGGSCPTVLSAADDVAVHSFLARKIGFTDIPKLVELVLAEHQKTPGRDAEELLEIDRWATVRAEELVKRTF